MPVRFGTVSNMPDLQPLVAHELLIAELRTLWQRGLDPARVRPLIQRCQLPRLVELSLGVDASIHNPRVATERVVTVVRQACEQVTDDATRAFARALFGLHSATQELSPAAARDYAVQMSGVGERQFRRTREPLILEVIAATLAQLVRQGEVDPLRALRSRELLDNPSKVFAKLSVESTLTFVTGRVPHSSTTSRRVRCLRDDTDTYVIEVFYSADSPLDVAVTSGGRLVRELERSLTGYRRYEVFLGDYLRAGQEHTLSYRVMVSPGFSPPQPYYTVGVDTPIPRATMRVRFAADALPVRVSRIVSVFSNFPVPAEPLRAVEVDRQHVAEQQFEQLKEGYKYGLIWRW